MLDAKEQKKGGFGAFAERQREKTADPAPSTAPVTDDATPAAPADDTDAQADGASTSEPHRQRFFRSLH